MCACAPASGSERFVFIVHSGKRIVRVLSPNDGCAVRVLLMSLMTSVYWKSSGTEMMPNGFIVEMNWLS